MPIGNKRQPSPVSRFSRERVAQRLALLVADDRFDMRLGWQQVAGKGEEMNRAYGAFDAAVAMVDTLDLWSEVNAILASKDK